jgi:hypothetical protein
MASTPTAATGGAADEKDRSNVNGTASAPKYTATGTKVDSQPGHEWHKPSPELVQVFIHSFMGVL